MTHQIIKKNLIVLIHTYQKQMYQIKSLEENLSYLAISTKNRCTNVTSWFSYETIKIVENLAIRTKNTCTNITSWFSYETITILENLAISTKK